MPYIRVRDRHIELELFPVENHERSIILWSVRLPGGRFYTHGVTPKEALDVAYKNLTTWRLNHYHPYEGQDLDSEYVKARLALNESKERLKYLVRVVKGPPKKIK